MMTHVELPGSHRPAKAGSTRLRNADPQSHMEVTLNLRAPELPDANQVAAQRMSAQDFAKKFGASQADVDKVTQTLAKYGLKVEDVSLPSHTMRVSGTVRDVEAAFQASLGIYHSADQGDFRGREGSIQVPAELNGIVTGVFGLDQRRVARRKMATAPIHTTAAHGLAPMTPADLEQHYNFPPGDGQGQVVAIAEFGGGYFPDDVAAFSKKNGLPAANVKVQSVNLPALTLAQIKQLPPDQQQQEFDMSGEVMMDIQIVAGLCPKATIIVYFATFDEKGWVDLMSQVVSGNPSTPVSLSISWGLAEDDPNWSAAARTAINQRMQAAAMQGITVCVASGDDGSGDQLTDGKGHVDFPSSSPFVLSVGGTMLTTASSHKEVVWWQSPGRRTNKGGGATGGGVSTLFARPTWQNVNVTSINPGSITGRIIPDIAALSGPPFYDLILLGQDAPNGGTSASTPLWAALIARINAKLPAAKQQQFLAPLLYQAGTNGKPRGQSGCIDITSGQNASHPQPGKGYTAQKGYDAVTGWGVPNGNALLTALSS